MLAVKGKCHLCQGQVSIMNPAMVCYECEKFHHGQCIDPPQSIQNMEQYVKTNVQWYCTECSRAGDVRIDERTKEDRKDVEDRLYLIIELREVLIKIEDALAQMKENNDELDDHTRNLKQKNDIMRKRIQLHEKLGFVVPKNLEDWIDKRKERQIDRQDFRPKKDPSLFTNKKDEFKKFLKKHAFFGDPKERKKARKQKNKEVQDRKDEQRKKEKEISFGRQFMREGLLYGSYRALKELSSNWRIQLILLFILVAYTIIGGFIFYWIEGEHERKYLEKIAEERDKIEKEIDTIRTLNLMVNFDEPTMMNVTNAWYSKYYDFVHSQITDYGKNLLSQGDHPVWDLYASVYFCAVTITIIDMTPVTNTGKIVLIFYALIGITLYFALLTTSAKTVTSLIKLIMKCCSCRCIKKKTDIDNFKEKAKQRQSLASFIGLRRQYDYIPLWLMLLITFIYISMGAIVYFFMDTHWNFLEGYYFIFTSITTIGFGDYVPTATWVIMFSTVYFFLGLTLAAVTIHVLVERFELSLESAHKKLEDYSEKHVERKKGENLSN